MAKSIPDRSWTYDLLTWPDSSNATSSPASGAGATRSGSPDGQTIEESGRAAVPASPGRPQARALVPTIRATFGLRGSSSFGSAALASSLESKLRRRLEGRGSIVFTLTWKRKTTPSGRSICLLRASARTTTGRGYGSWPTPLVNDTHGSGYGYNRSNHESISLKLCGVVKLASWPTAKAADADRGGDERRYKGDQSQNGRRSNLVDAVMLAPWATATATDKKGASRPRFDRTGTKQGDRLATQVVTHVSGRTKSGFRAAMAWPVQLNPDHSRWLQGYPASWAHSSPGWKARALLLELLLATEASSSTDMATPLTPSSAPSS